MLKNPYTDRLKSCVVRELMDATGKSFDEMAKAAGVTTLSFRNKLSRNVWSFDEIIALCNFCRCDVTIKHDGHIALNVEIVTEKEIVI